MSSHYQYTADYDGVLVQFHGRTVSHSEQQLHCQSQLLGMRRCSQSLTVPHFPSIFTSNLPTHGSAPDLSLYVCEAVENPQQSCISFSTNTTLPVLFYTRLWCLSTHPHIQCQPRVLSGLECIAKARKSLMGRGERGESEFSQGLCEIYRQCVCGSVFMQLLKQAVVDCSLPAQGMAGKTHHTQTNVCHFLSLPQSAVAVYSRTFQLCAS
jgi:hypothetical protein